MLIYFAIAKESESQLVWFLSHLRAVYPMTTILAISDGPFRGTQVLRRYGCHFIEGQKLKSLEFGGAWWHRALSEMLRYDWSFAIKVDPDTCFWRGFRTWPLGDVFGRIEGQHIQGGCQGFRRDAAERLMSSRVFLDPLLRKRETWCPWEPLESDDYLSTDLTLAWACKALRLKVSDWPECGCWWKEAPGNTNLQYAVTHPHKLEES